MDKVTLTKEQLEELKVFINSRGFVEPVVVLEILDHFACKVEEELEQNPQYSLKKAMAFSLPISAWLNRYSKAVTQPSSIKP